MRTKTIQEYKLYLLTEQQIPMPTGALILSARVNQEGELCVYALIDPNLKPEQVIAQRLFIYGNNDTIGDAHLKKFIGTVLYNDSIFHVFCY